MPGGHAGTQGSQSIDSGAPPGHSADLISTRAASRDPPDISEAAEAEHRRFSILVAKSYYSEMLVAFFGFIKILSDFFLK